TVLMVHNAGTPEQKKWCEAMITGEMRVAFGLTEPDHGSDATWLETTAVRDGDEWVINGAKRFNTGLDVATHDMVFARTSGQQGEANGITSSAARPAPPGSTANSWGGPSTTRPSKPGPTSATAASPDDPTVA